MPLISLYSSATHIQEKLLLTGKSIYEEAAYECNVLHLDGLDDFYADMLSRLRNTTDKLFIREIPYAMSFTEYSKSIKLVEQLMEGNVFLSDGFVVARFIEVLAPLVVDTELLYKTFDELYRLYFGAFSLPVPRKAIIMHADTDTVEQRAVYSILAARLHAIEVTQTDDLHKAFTRAITL